MKLQTSIIILIVLLATMGLAYGNSSSVSINGEVNIIGTYTPPTVTISASITPVIFPGQIEIFTATAIGGTSPYTYNYIIVNSITNVLLANMLFTSCTLTTNSFSWSVPNTDFGNTVVANVFLTDAHPTTVNSVNTSVITISGGFSTLNITSTPPPIILKPPINILFILFFSSAILFTIAFLVMLPGDLKKQSIRPLFILLFAIGPWVATLPAYVAPLNTIATSYPSYNIIAGTQTIQYPPYTVNTISALQVRTYNAYFYIWIIILAFLFFLLLLWFLLLLRTRAQQLLEGGKDVIEKFEKSKDN